MDELISSFLDFTGSQDPAVAKQYLDATANDLEYAVQLYLESTANGPQPDDEQLAQSLQQEAYGAENDVREADASVHQHATLVDGFDPMYNVSRPTDIFGGGRIGIFNQRFDQEENDYYEDRSSDDDVVELDSDGEPIEPVEPPRSRRRVNRQNRLNELSSTQRRLANLFRPPFDIMEKVSIDGAKTLGRQQKKWILVNIQDATEFRCQVLNRDFWSSKLVKDKVKENFVFLQFQHDSPNGEQYVNFYNVSQYPHIAILDPLTGERVYKFVEGSVPDVDEWLEEVDKFLGQFSLFGDNNPVVEHEVKFDPDTLTEEQQIEYAMKQSAKEAGKSEEPEPEPEPQDVFESIKPKDHDVEGTSDPTTRIQIRFPSGKRLVHKFKVSDNVYCIYEWLKYVLSTDDYGLSANDRFVITNTSDRLIKLLESLDKSIEDAKLKNASILLEKE